METWNLEQIARQRIEERRRFAEQASRAARAAVPKQRRRSTLRKL